MSTHVRWLTVNSFSLSLKGKSLSQMSYHNPFFVVLALTEKVTAAKQLQQTGSSAAPKFTPRKVMPQPLARQTQPSLSFQ
jgi:hypothetical protein